MDWLDKSMRNNTEMPKTTSCSTDKKNNITKLHLHPARLQNLKENVK